MTAPLRSAWLALLAGLLPLACSAPVPPAPPPASRVAEGGVCRLGPGGTPPDAAGGAEGRARRPVDQGIGGTGAPLRLADTVPVDQGIGGTGLGPAGGVPRPADPGGRLGVVGVITGFASVCVDGLEIGYDDATTVKLDGALATPRALRAGQVVVLDAGGGLDPRAAGIAVRHEVSGPVERLDPGLAVVAGQRVRVSDATWGAEALQPDAWVAVSGLRDGLGVIQATRVDPRVPGPVSVRGRLVPGAVPRIGQLAVRASPLSQGDATGGDVEASGRYVDGSLLADSVAPDLLSRDPVAYFGKAVDHYVVEAYATARPGELRMGDGLQAAYHGAGAPAGEGRRVIALTRDVNGTGLVATGIIDVVPSSGQAGPAAGGARPAAGPGPQGGAGSTTRAGAPGGDTQALAPAPMPGSPGPPRAGDMGSAFGGGGPPPDGSASRGFPSAGAPAFPGGAGLPQGGQGFGGGGRSGGR